MYRNYIFEGVNDALPTLMNDLLVEGEEHGSRNGAVKELTHVGITLTHPMRREIILDERKPNIAAQIAETAWVLAGRNDLDFLSHYLPRAADFSDDGFTWRAGYGPRLRHWFGSTAFDGQRIHTDQWGECIRLLRESPLTRRAVMSIFDPAADYGDSKDIPCNNWVTFSSRLGRLDMHVGIRSNDLMWGWSGINAFEWSVLLEITAAMTGVQPGALHFSTTNLHLYAPHWAKGERIAEECNHVYRANGLLDSPRFDHGAIPFNNMQGLDDLLSVWFQVEQNIRDGNVHDSQIEDFPEPMLRSWLRVLRWWWTGDHKHLEPLAMTRLEYATHVSVQPPTRTEQETSFGTATVFTETPEKPTESDFMRYTCATHDEKHAAYGNSWKKRGEQMSIMANIARKVDRLGGADTSDETSADTAMDLFVYLAKYLTWIHDQRLGINNSDNTSFTNSLMRSVEQAVTKGEAFDAGGVSVTHLEQWLRGQFDTLEKAVTDNNPSKLTFVEAMLVDAYKLARLRWELANAGDDYRGADVD